MLKPQNTPRLDRGSHRGIFLPACKDGFKTYTGQPQTCIFCSLCRGTLVPKNRSLGEILLDRGMLLYT